MPLVVPECSGTIALAVPDETGRKPTLSAPQEKALAALLEGATVTGAADAAGVTRQTVSGWQNHDAEFAAELQNRRAELWAGALARIEASIPAALDVLTGLLKDADPRLRLAAANRILAPVFLHPEDRVVPQPTTADALRRDRERARRSAERTDILLRSLEGA
jgi:hypothetical protein